MQSLVAEVEAVNRVLTELAGTDGDGFVVATQSDVIPVVFATQSDGGDRRVGLEGFSDGLASLWTKIVPRSIDLFDIQKSRAEEHETASSSTSNHV